MAKQALYSIHIQVFHCVRTHHFHGSPYFDRGGPKMGACGKDKVLPQPDGSILSGGIVTVLYK